MDKTQDDCLCSLNDVLIWFFRYNTVAVHFQSCLFPECLTSSKFSDNCTLRGFCSQVISYDDGDDNFRLTNIDVVINMAKAETTS